MLENNMNHSDNLLHILNVKNCYKYQLNVIILTSLTNSNNRNALETFSWAVKNLGSQNLAGWYQI